MFFFFNRDWKVKMSSGSVHYWIVFIICLQLLLLCDIQNGVCLLLLHVQHSER